VRDNVTHHEKARNFRGVAGKLQPERPISQPTVLPSGQVKIGCWPGCLSLQPVNLQSPALAEPDTAANTERPNKAVMIVLMIIFLQGVDPRRGGEVPDGGYHLMSGNSFIERLQAARHSTLVMCVAASQKPMQSASDLPPPPGLLGADWLGLLPPDEVSGERASEEPPEEPLPVANWLGKGSDNGDSVGTVDVVAAGAPAGGVNPAEGVGDNGVDGAAGVVGPEDPLGVVVVRKVVVGAEIRGLGAATDAGEPPADERTCANAASGSSSKRTMAARTGGLGVSIESPWRCRQYP
jgi:hypothetical protein